MFNFLTLFGSGIWSICCIFSEISMDFQVDIQVTLFGEILAADFAFKRFDPLMLPDVNLQA
jgi:hypothetical protein